MEHGFFGVLNILFTQSSGFKEGVDGAFEFIAGLAKERDSYFFASEIA